MKEITIIDLLKNGVHFGHQKSKWHPKMKDFIFNTRNGVHIINLEKTVEELEKARTLAKKMASEGKIILFVGTKRQAKIIVQKYAKVCSMPFITERWLGGMFTNFQTVSKLTKKLNSLKKQQAAGELEKYTKKEQLEFAKEIQRLDKFVGGIADMKKIPDAVFVVGLREEKTAVREARKKHIPLFGIADSNINPELLTWPIPGNDDATKSIEILVSIMSEAIQEGVEAFAQSSKEKTVKEEVDA